MHRSAGGAAHWKRKRHQYDSGTYSGYENQYEERQKTLALLHIQAHEADIVHGLEGKDRAQSLEVDGLGRPGPRSALIQLGRSNLGASAGWNAEEDNFTLSGGSSTSRKTAHTDERVQLWVDRYDARLLLDSFTLLSLDASTGSQPPSPTLSTWSDFPEDSQETFFLNQEEVEEYDRRKRRRLLDEAYERRRKEREEEEAEVHQGEQDHSQPNEEALVLMQRTATHLLSASNPAQLEMRILANHGADERFSFLREGGRWHDTWLDIKMKAADGRMKEKEAATFTQAGLGGIAGYGSDSESDDDSEDHPPPEPPAPPNPPPPPPPLPAVDPPEPSAPAQDSKDSTEAAKEERRARAKEWMLNRRKEKENGA